MLNHTFRNYCMLKTSTCYLLHLHRL